MKIEFKYTSTLVFLLLLCGCAQTQTDKLWSAPTYTERINQFLINPEDKSLIIIGEKYHYIFNEDSAPLVLLGWSSRKNLHAFFYAFEVNSENIVTGTYSLNSDSKKASIEEINWLKSNGFKINKSGLYTKTLKVSGTRYLAGNVHISNSSHLNKQYRISIERPNSTFETISKTALTPITVTSDAVTVIGGTALLVAIAVPIMAVGGVVSAINSVVSE
jgi:hypothetical protein